jgi:nitronate monooxygenase
MKELLAELELGIIQAGMSVRISLSELVGSVCEEGGLGVIGAAFIGAEEKDVLRNYREANIRALRREINRTKELTKRPFGVNTMKVLTNYPDTMVIAIEEGVSVIFCGSASALDMPGFLREGDKTKLVPKVSKAKAAATITKWWLKHHNYFPPAIAVEGPMAGGHLGFSLDELNNPLITLADIIDDVKRAIRPFEIERKKEIPIIAAGGIYTGEDIYKLQQSGVSGFKMATRFVATEECAADINFKRAYIDCKKEDLVIINSPVGLPGRAINDDFLEKMKAGKRRPVVCPYHCLIGCKQGDSLYCIARALKNASRGKLDRGFAFAGANAYRTEKISTVKEVMAAIRDEYRIASQG